MKKNIQAENSEDKKTKGTWVILFRIGGGGNVHINNRNALTLRIINSITRVIMKNHSYSNVSGILTFSEISLIQSRFSVEKKDGDVKVICEIPVSLLQENKKKQIDLLTGFLSGKPFYHNSLILKDEFGVANSRTKNKIVQFITVESLFEKRDLDFAFVPPASFYMSQALLKNGFSIEVDKLEIETLKIKNRGNFRNYRDKAINDLKSILAKKPFCIAITVVDLYLEQIQWLIKKIRSTDRDVIIAVGGPFPTIFPEKSIVHLSEANIFIRGEADFAFNDVLSIIYKINVQGSSPAELLELIKLQRGLFVNLPEMILISSLNKKNFVHKLSEVFRHDFDLSFIKKKHILNGVFLSTSRGCPYHCKFCLKIHGSKVRQLSVDRVTALLEKYLARIEEIRLFEGLSNDEYQKALTISFTDDDFFVHAERSISILNRISQLPLRVQSVSCSIPSFFSIPSGKNRASLNFDIFEILTKINHQHFILSVGTDDFAETELKKLGKGNKGSYSTIDVRNIITELNNRNIINKHFLILTNPFSKWSDIILKMMHIETFSWEFITFQPSPNPFILSTHGTAFHREIIESNLEKRLIKQNFSINGLVEYDHDTVNISLPDPDIFTSEKESCQNFFKRINDLIKTKYRYFILNEVYIHFFKTFNANGYNTEDRTEVLKCFKGIIKCLKFRFHILQQVVSKPSYIEYYIKDSLERINITFYYIAGTFLMYNSIQNLFCSSFYLTKISEFKEEYPAELFYNIFRKFTVDTDILETESFFKNILSLNFMCTQGISNDISNRFISEIYKEICDSGQKSRAEVWLKNVKDTGNLVEINIINNGRDYEFQINDRKMTHLLSLTINEKVERELITQKEVAFLEVEAVIRKSVKENFLKYSGIRIPLYSKWLKVNPIFKIRYNEEFGFGSYMNDEEMILSVISRFLTLQVTGCHSEILGTDIFKGYETLFIDIIPDSILYFVNWMFGRKISN